jgi:autotransporter-associated beta strand protein/T5SS/PEP-CTERM-associated repeat protein
MKPKFANLFRTATALVTLSSAAQAQTIVDWNGSTSADWNTAANWDGGVIPTKTPGNHHARINGANPATISADITPPVDIFVGSGASGTLNHTSGVASTGSGNWMFVGHNGGNGTYNLANTAASGGTFTGFGTGSGTMNVAGRLYIGGFAGTGSTGTVNVNTSASLAIGGQLQIGTNNSVGTLNIDAGSVTAQDWTEIGNGGGSTGNLNMSGGSLVKTGANNVIIAANGATGNATITGGRLESNNEFWIANATGSKGTLTLSDTGEIVSGNAFVVGRGTGATGFGRLIMSGGTITKNGANNFAIGDGGGIGEATVSGGTISVNNEFWVGNGTNSNGLLTLSGGTISNNSWVAIGRGAGQGTVDMTGGTWNKTGDSNFIIGASGSGITSTMNMSGGTVNVSPSATVNRGVTWIGEQNGVTGVLNLSGTAEFNTARITLGELAGATGNLNLNGGTLRTSQLSGGAGNANVTFNGTQIIATASQAAFIANLDTSDVGNGGVLIDSQAFTITTAQNLAGVGTGGLTKTGSGVLTLNGTNTFNGNGTVTAGVLVGGSSGALPGWNSSGRYTVASGAAFGGTLGGTGFTTSDFSTLLSSASFTSGSSVAIDTTAGSETYSADIGTLTSAGTSVGLVKTGANTLTIDPLGQSYTGPTRLAGGTLSFDSGASDATFAQAINTTGGNFDKSGAGTLTITHATPTFGGAGGAGLGVSNGTLAFSGGGTQVASVTGEVWVGTGPSSGGNLVLQDTSLTASSWLAVARGTGNAGHSSTITATNSTLQTANFSTGFNNGIVDNNSTSSITLNNSSWTNNGLNNLAESSGSTSTITLNGTSTFSTNNRVFIGQSAGATGHVILNGSSTFTQSAGWLAIGNSGTGTLTVSDNAIFTNTAGDFNVADLASSNGTLTLEDSGTVNAASTYVGKGTSSTGLVTQTGGTFNSNADNLFQIGVSGQGTWDQSGGTTNSNGWVSVGRNASGNGALNVSAGTFNQNNTARALIIGEDGTGTLTISGTGAVNVASTGLGVSVGGNATGVGTVNLDGGTLTANRLQKGLGSATINFNGGTLLAGSDAQTDFLSGFNSANVESGGAIIDTNGMDISISQNLLDAGGNGGLTKTGTGTLTLSGNNTYTGQTTISEGTLAITSTAALASSTTISIASGATLDVSAASGWSLATGQSLVSNGSFAGTATIGAGSTIAPGNSIGTLTFSDDLILAGTADMEVQDGTADLIAVAGALTYGGVLDITNIGGTLQGYAYAPTVFNLFDFDTQSGTFDSINLPTLDSGYSWTSFDYGNGSISIIPETSSTLLAALGSLALLRRRRR